MKRLIVVSNRVTPSDSGNASAGGMAVALLAALKQRGGLWFGWNGEACQNRDINPEIIKTGSLTFATIPLPEPDIELYYNGYANRSLWPLFHYRTDLALFDYHFFEAYLRVNSLFTTKLAPLLNEDDLIWVHDYHLIPMGQCLRDASMTQPIGFFLHTPFPAMEILLTLPNHESIVKGLCAYDLVGFQSTSDLRAFHDYILHEAEGEILEDGVVRAFGRVLIARVYAISIDTEGIAKQSVHTASTKALDRLTESLDERMLIIGVDRLDYSKGLAQRFRALERLLENYPENRNKVVLLQIAPPSRTDVPEYADIRHELETLAGSINGHFAEFDWVPIRYLNKGYTLQQLAGFYRASRVGLVTPLRDGMNLVAKEFVAAQNPTDPGVLVLSRFAGAAQELSEALIVNPFDIDDLSDAMQRAITMPLKERRERWGSMMKTLTKNDISAWRDTFLTDLERASAVLDGA